MPLFCYDNNDGGAVNFLVVVYVWELYYMHDSNWNYIEH